MTRLLACDLCGEREPSDELEPCAGTCGWFCGYCLGAHTCDYCPTCEAGVYCVLHDYDEPWDFEIEDQP